MIDRGFAIIILNEMCMILGIVVILGFNYRGFAIIIVCIYD